MVVSSFWPFCVYGIYQLFLWCDRPEKINIYSSIFLNNEIWIKFLKYREDNNRLVAESKVGIKESPETTVKHPHWKIGLHLFCSEGISSILPKGFITYYIDKKITDKLHRVSPVFSLISWYNDCNATVIDNNTAYISILLHSLMKGRGVRGRDIPHTMDFSLSLILLLLLEHTWAYTACGYTFL